MSNFRFSLQSVDKLRQRHRDAAADSLRQAIEAKNQLTQQVDQLLSEADEQTQFQSRISDGALQIQQILESQRFQLHLLSQVKVIRDKIELIEKECSRRQAILVEREKEVRAIEKLRLAQLAEWKHVQEVRQQQRLDEWASFRFWKNSQSDETASVE